MPNYFVTNTARFNPFTYQELATPLLQATQQHLAMEEALSSLDDGTLATYLAGESQDSPYVTDYKKLSKRIENLSQQLSAEGISGAMIREALKLKGDYKKFSTPVETAGKRRYQLMDEYRKLKASNPYLIGEDPGQKDLAFYINNPNYNPEYDNGEAYIKQGTLIGSQLADQLRNPNAPYTVVPGSGGAFLRAVYRRGYSPEELATDPMFVNITNQIMQSRGIDPNGTDARTNAVRSYIQQGLFSSLGKDDVDMKNNPSYLNPLQQMQYKTAKLNNEKLQAEIDALKNPQQQDYGSMMGTDTYEGKDYPFYQKLFGKNGVVKDYSDNPIVTNSGIEIHNSLEAYQYLAALKNKAMEHLEKSRFGSSASPTQEQLRHREQYDSSIKVYEKEKELLEKYALSKKDYKDIKKTLEFDNDNFTVDDVEDKINSSPERFLSGLIPKFEIANAANSKSLLDTYMNYINQGIASLVQKGDSEGQFFYTDKVNVLKDRHNRISVKKMQDILGGKDTEIYGLNGTKELLLNDDGTKPYVYLSTNKGDIAVPVSFLQKIGIPLDHLAKVYKAFGVGYFDNTEDAIGAFDDRVETSNAFGIDREIYNPEASKGKMPRQLYVPKKKK